MTRAGGEDEMNLKYPKLDLGDEISVIAYPTHFTITDTNAASPQCINLTKEQALQLVEFLRQNNPDN